MLDIQKRLTNGFYVILSLPATAMGFALSVQISALSFILSTQYHLEIEDIGLVWAAGPIAGIIGQVLIGVISDNVWFLNGRRRPFILIGGILAALMLLALPNIGVIAEGMGVDGILGVAIAVALTLDLAINISFNPTRSVIADVTPEGKARTKGYTWMQTISGTFGVLAYAVGAIWDNYVLIYTGAGLVLLLSVLPVFFITEPRSLKAEEGAEHDTKTPGFSALEALLAIRPLWGFLLYAVYGIVLRAMSLDIEGYLVEGICLALTLGLMAQALMKSETGKSKAEAGQIGFQKVLAAHAFTWVGVQTMFVYMFSYVQYRMPELGPTDMGRVVSISFLILNAVAAVLPATILEPLASRIGRVKTHMACIAIMAAGYAGMVFLGFTPLLIYAMMGVLGVGWAATVSLPFAIMSQKVDQAKMGLYMGLFNLSVVLPQLVASLGIGQAIGAAENKNLVFILCAASLGISALGWVLVKEEQQTE
ncbi:MFS transporter [Phaeodactylibacter luteus]|uniref:SLC45 family MFS transporter n=1 Tax=Phaeodactylibacter luteus TaxID=1564516 RepID=A0A5C6RFV4_9BACT|nr:MFS transporter [Phaeodactylibacter luteus]TXB61298.1 SLC45 family MFS transporter [Phaeodactylibacter luteus]